MIVGYTVTLSKVGNSYRVVIPKPACIGLQWNRGDKLNLSVEEGKITITKALFMVQSKGPVVVVVHPEKSATTSKALRKEQTPSPVKENTDWKPLYVPKESGNDPTRKKKKLTLS